MKITTKINLWGRRLHLAPFMFSHHAWGLTIFTIVAVVSLLPILNLCAVKDNYGASMGLSYVYPFWAIGFSFFVCCYAAYFGARITVSAKSADAAVIALGSFSLDVLICTIHAIVWPCIALAILDRPPLMAPKLAPAILFSIIKSGGMSLFLAAILSSNKQPSPLAIILTVIICYPLSMIMTFVLHV